jgi:hypothetical protein
MARQWMVVIHPRLISPPQEDIVPIRALPHLPDFVCMDCVDPYAVPRNPENGHIIGCRSVAEPRQPKIMGEMMR